MSSPLSFSLSWFFPQHLLKAKDREKRIGRDKEQQKTTFLLDTALSHMHPESLAAVTPYIIPLIFIMPTSFSLAESYIAYLCSHSIRPSVFHLLYFHQNMYRRDTKTSFFNTNNYFSVKHPSRAAAQGKQPRLLATEPPAEFVPRFFSSIHYSLLFLWTVLVRQCG